MEENNNKNKISDLRYKNPIIPAYGKTKGFFNGAINSLGDNLVPVSFITLALATKGVFSKIGAWGVVGCGLVHLLRDGFGIGRTSFKD